MGKIKGHRETCVQPLGGSALTGAPVSQYFPEKPTRSGATFFSIVVAVVTFVVVMVVSYYGLGILDLWVVVVGFIVSALATMSIHIAMEWERLVVFRFGAFNRVVGPGLVCTVPVIEQVACRVDVRTIATTFGAEKTLTSDLVPVNIDAVLYWMVWDAKKACVEVEDYCSAVLYIAQTAMRDAIGRASVAEVALSRDQLDEELKRMIEEETEPWGIAILSVKIRDIVIPEELQEAMSSEAQAEREKNARLVLASAEQDIAEMISMASEAYANNEAALKVRTLHLLYDSMKKSGGSIVTVPSSMSDGIGGNLAEGLDGSKGKI